MKNEGKGMERVPHVAIYTRVSTKEQEAEGLSKDAQPALCLKKLDEKFGPGGYTYELFEDLGKSGSLGPLPWATECKRRERQGLWGLVQGVRAGRFTHVVAYRGDRVYRNHLGAIGFYTDLLRPNGVRLLYVAEDFDESLGGQLVAGVLATVAEHQRRQVGENIARTLEFRRSAGYYMGAVPYGWRRETDEEKRQERRNIVPVPEEREVVVRIKDMYLSGMSAEAIARALNQEGVPQKRGIGNWQSTTVLFVLHNPTHAGLCRATKDGPLTPGLHYEDRFYEEEDYVRVLDRTARNRTRLKGVSCSQPFRLFAGLAFCGGCSKRLQSVYHTDKAAYRCLGDRATGGPSHVYVSATALERAIVGLLGRLASDPVVREEAERQVEETVRSQDEALKRETAALRNSLDSLDAQSSRLTEAVKFGTMPNEVAKRAFDELLQQDKELRLRLKRATDALAASEHRTALIRAAVKALDSFPVLWDAMTDAERRECVHTVVERIDVVADEKGKRLVVRLATQAGPVDVPLARGVDRYVRERPGGVAALTPREAAALYHASRGLDYNQTAVLFETKGPSVHGLLSRAREKLGAATNKEAWDMAGPLFRDCLGQLPLFGKDKSPRRAKHRLRPTEFKVLELSAKGESAESLSMRTGMPLDRLQALLDSAVAKAGCDGVLDAWKKVEGERALWPRTMLNREDVG